MTLYVMITSSWLAKRHQELLSQGLAAAAGLGASTAQHTKLMMGSEEPANRSISKPAYEIVIVRVSAVWDERQRDDPIRSLSLAPGIPAAQHR